MATQPSLVEQDVARYIGDLPFPASVVREVLAWADWPALSEADGTVRSIGSVDVDGWPEEVVSTVDCDLTRPPNWTSQHREALDIVAEFFGLEVEWPDRGAVNLIRTIVAPSIDPPPSPYADLCARRRKGISEDDLLQGYGGAS